MAPPDKSKEAMTMETKIERLTTKDGGCAELATIIHDGQEFTVMGAAVWTDEKGKLRGVLYTSTPEKFDGPGNVRPLHLTHYLTSWDGKIKIPCTIGSTWENSPYFRDYHGRRQVNQSFYFTINGRKCRGVNYNREWSQIVRFKEI
jgi:hypothetical protein